MLAGIEGGNGNFGVRVGGSADENNADTGGTDFEDKFFGINTRASAGLGIKVADPVMIDFVVNLTNFTSSTFFQTPVIAASVMVDF